MDIEAMPDITGVPPADGGTADEMLDDADELENLLEDALEENEAEEEQAPAPMEVAATAPAMPAPAAQPTPSIALGRSFIQNTTQNALETMPRSSDGLIDVEKLTPEQHRVYNAAIMNLLTDEQQQRYEFFRRSTLKEPMKKLIQVVSGSKPDSQSKIMIALCSVSKTFVGELVEEAKRVAEAEGHKGPLQPTHVMEGYQNLMAAGLVESIQNGRPKLRL